MYPGSVMRITHQCLSSINTIDAVPPSALTTDAVLFILFQEIPAVTFSTLASLTERSVALAYGPSAEPVRIRARQWGGI